MSPLSGKTQFGVDFIRFSTHIMRTMKIPEFPDYDISDLGVITRATKCQGARVGRIAKPYLTPTGYRYVLIYDYEKRPKHRPVHALMLQAYVGPKPSPKHQAAHLNGNRLDNRLSNLAWTTPKENNAHKLLHGTQTRGQSSPASKLTEADVKSALAMRSEGFSAAKVAAKFGVSAGAILAIEKGRNWKHLGIIPQPNRCKGNSAHNAVLNEEKVRFIRSEILKGRSQRSIANDLGIGNRLVNCVALGKTWSHVK